MGEVRSARESIFYTVVLAATIALLYTFQAEFQDSLPIRFSSYYEIESVFGVLENAEESKYDFESERSCNHTFYELTHGEEGRLDNGTLTGVHIFLRHGHRTAMDSKRAKKTPRNLCDIRSTVKKMMINQKACFTSTLESAMSVYTQSDKCISSQLTALGVEQHKRLGSFLRSRYSSFTPDFAVHSTTYSRTFLSALSFLSTFDTSICTKTAIMPTKDTYFRGEAKPCPSSILLKKHFKEKTWTNTSIEYRQKLTKLYKDTWVDVIADQLFIESCSSSSFSHRCKTSAKHEKCLSDNDFKNFTSMLEYVNYEYFKNENYQRHSYLSVKPLIKRLFAETQNYQIYSGHDLTIGAILSYFDFFPSFRIPFASRVVFEFFEGDSFRLLFNGVQIFPKLLNQTVQIAEFSDEEKFKKLFPSSKSMKDACSKQLIENFRRRKRHLDS
ncbi:unnamed protein product [Oikopleura dioica]|uniref:2-phosphoxylose phosphatase 1 n=1 Tax=Oikopleura dioica TaxID=34765 RepID=E4Y8A2_OIKDI|nr:unnamed protein product [Oikopleura dioica]